MLAHGGVRTQRLAVVDVRRVGAAVVSRTGGTELLDPIFVPGHDGNSVPPQYRWNWAAS